MAIIFSTELIPIAVAAVGCARQLKLKEMTWPEMIIVAQRYRTATELDFSGFPSVNCSKQAHCSAHLEPRSVIVTGWQP